jgi:phosphoribosylamine--glycine ligase
MRILGVGGSCDLASMYLRLQDAGHEVRVFIADFAESGVMAGMLDRVESWRDQLDWVRAAGADGVVVFETADRGEVQDELRRDGFFVIGGSALGDRLENDRAYGQSVLAQIGLRSSRTQTFDDFDAAERFIRAHPRRYVFKLNGSATASWRNFVGSAPDGSDVVAWLRGQQARLQASGVLDASFVLTEHVAGVETGIGAFWNGERFLEPACLDWEHKRFFNADLGELTGEMGTLVTYRDSQRLFGLTLAKLAPWLRESGYVGYINLNTIINDDGIWGLELTCRFGYPGFAILDALQLDSWDRMFALLRDRGSTRFATADGFAVGVVLTVPPFPYRYGYAEIAKGLPILIPETLSPSERARLHFSEVALAGDRLVTSGTVGYVMVANGVGASVEAAQREAYALAGKIVLPNVRYRTDIGDRFVRQDRAFLQRLGYLP